MLRMEKGNGWKEFIGKSVKIVYEDGLNHFSTKLGKIISFNQTHVIISSGSSKYAINLSKILRIEESLYG